MSPPLPPSPDTRFVIYDGVLIGCVRSW